jgi:hypothetical protein
MRCPFKARGFASAARGDFDVHRVRLDLHFSTKPWIGVSMSQRQGPGRCYNHSRARRLEDLVWETRPVSPNQYVPDINDKKITSVSINTCVVEWMQERNCAVGGEGTVQVCECVD